MEVRDLQMALEPYQVRISKVLDERISVFCPFHKGGQERNASMSIYVESGAVVCFTCGYRKGLGQFLMDLGMAPEVAKNYAEAVKSATPSERSRQPRHELIAWLGYFRKYLPRNLVEAGFTPKTLDRFEVGYDTRYSRVTYPVRNKYGDLIAFVGGAVSKDEVPKYKLYDTELDLPKGAIAGHRDHLWGFHLLPEDKPFIVVEGYKACMWLVQHGYHACATQGTVFSNAQVETIVNAYRPVKVMFDQDGPGQEAGQRLCEKLMSLIGQRASLVVYPRPDARQPDWLKPEELAALFKEEHE